MNGNIGIPSLLFTRHFSKRLLSAYKETLGRQSPNERIFFYSSLAGMSVLCVMDNFSNKVYSISQLENMSSITWKRDE